MDKYKKIFVTPKVKNLHVYSKGNNEEFSLKEDVMSKHTMDAIKVARMIQQDNLSPLRGKSFKMENNHDKIKKKPGGKMEKKYTLNQLGTTVDKLTTKVDQLTDELKELAKMVKKGFKRVDSRIDSVEQRMDAGFKQVNDRLNYIVTANNLKDLPSNKKK